MKINCENYDCIFSFGGSCSLDSIDISSAGCEMKLVVTPKIEEKLRQKYGAVKADDYEKAQNKAKLKEMYIDKEMSLAVMSKELGIPKTTLYNKLKSFGILDEKKKLDAIKKGEWRDDPGD